MGNWEHCVTTHGISIVLLSYSLFKYISKIKYIFIWGNLPHMDCIHIWFLKHTFLKLWFTMFPSCRLSDTDPLIFYDFNSDESPHRKYYMVGTSQHLGVILHVLRERSIIMSLIWGTFKKRHKGGICCPCSYCLGPTWRFFFI